MNYQNNTSEGVNLCKRSDSFGEVEELIKTPLMRAVLCHLPPIFAFQIQRTKHNPHFLNQLKYPLYMIVNFQGSTALPSRGHIVSNI